MGVEVGVLVGSGVLVGVAVCVGVGVGVAVGGGVEVRVGVVDVVTTGVDVGNTATDVAVEADPHAANSKKLKHTAMLPVESTSFVFIFPHSHSAGHISANVQAFEQSQTAVGDGQFPWHTGCVAL